MKQSILLLFIVALLSSCSGSSDKATSSTPAVVDSKVPTDKEEAPVPDEMKSHPGYALYNQHCLPCHQADGNGVPGMYPPLTDTKWVNGDVGVLVDIVVKGMNEEIEVDGEIYKQIMAPLPYLTDLEVANILSFVRKKFGSEVSEVTLEEVSKHRN